MKILKAIGLIVLFLIIYQAAQLLVMFVVGIVYTVGQFMTSGVSGAQPSFDELLEALTSHLAAQTPWILLIAIAISLPTYYLFYRERRQELLTFVSVRGIGPLSIPVLIVFSISVSFILDLVLMLLSQLDIFSQVFNSYEQVSGFIFGGGFFLTLLSVGIIGPVFEEILFRGLIFGELRKITKVKAALIIQALLFGIYHMNIIQGVYAVLLGLLIGFVYYRSNSIIAPIIMHVTINSLSVIVNEFVAAEQIEKWALVVIVACVALFFLTGAFILISKSFRRSMDDSLYYAGRLPKQLETDSGQADEQ